MVSTLLTEMDAQEALETQQQANVAMIPHTKDRDRSRFLKHVGRRISRMEVPPPPKPRTPTVHDPEAAARWFADQGITVVRSS